MLRWLANLSSRRLLNRIHYILYDRWQGEAASGELYQSNSVINVPGSLFKVSQELDHQLHAWFDLLPPNIKPDLDNDYPSVEDAVLIMRFHAAGDIIYRPFLHQVCDLGPGMDIDPRVVENAKKCLGHCRGYLNAVQHTLNTPVASLEIFLHA